MAGVKFNESCFKEFQEFIQSRSYNFLVFKLSDNLDEVVVDRKGEHNAKLADIAHSLPADEPRYAVIDIQYDLGKNEGVRSKLIFIMWCPDTATIKHKMVYAATAEGFRRSLPGVQVYMRAESAAELEFSDVMSKFEQRNPIETTSL